MDAPSLSATLPAKAMARPDLDIADIHVIAVACGGALQVFGGAQRCSRFHRAVKVPRDWCGHVRDDEQAVCLCADANLTVRVSKDFEISGESARVLRDQANFSAGHWLALMH
jgi:chorismate mutase